MTEDELPRLSKKRMAAVEAYRSNGGDEVAAYIEAYPASISWKSETVQAKATALFKERAVKLHLLPKKDLYKAKPMVRKKDMTKSRKNSPNYKPPPPQETKLTPALIKIIVAYPDNYESKHKHAFPQVEGLAKVCKVSRQTLHNWVRQGVAEVQEAMKKIDTYQRFDLAQKTFKGEGNARIAALILKTKHGYVETQVIEHQGAGGGPIQSANMQITADMAPDEAAKLYMEMISE